MAHIDWITIVGRRDVESDWTVAGAYQSASDWLADRSPIFKEAFGSALDWQIVKPRAPYAYARRSGDNTRTLYVHPLAAHFTLEVSGQHCNTLNQAQIVETCASYAGCFSRIDVAVDMETNVTPLQFESTIDMGRIKTRSQMQSSTGQTVYIGSRSSERFTRIYRYNAPHPRAHLLRAEFQLKSTYANALADEIAAGVTLDSLAAGLGQHFGFNHPCWQVDNPIALPAVKSHAQSGSTVYWLTNTVAPLLRRLKSEQKLDVEQWFETYVLQTDVSTSE